MDQFKELEQKVKLAAERIQHLAATRLELEEQVSKLREERRGLRARVKELEAGQAVQSAEVEELARLREERTEIAGRVERLIDDLAALELEEKPKTARKKAATG